MAQLKPDSTNYINRTPTAPGQNSIQPTEPKIFTFVEEQPSFPGGDDAMMKYLITNIIYPREERDNGVMGTVFVTFVVSAEGNVRDVKVVREVKDGPGFTTEALRLVNKMPRWTPGKLNGEAVAVQFNLPIKFLLRGPAAKSNENKQVESGPVKALKLFNSGKIEMDAQRFSIAETLFTKSIQLLPNVDTYYNRAICYLNQNNDLGFCSDLFNAGELGDLESANLFEQQCQAYGKEFFKKQQPSFPGGEAAMLDFLHQKIRYPETSMNKGIGGTVYITFLVTKNGEITDVKIAKGVVADIDFEALRVVSLMPRWEPAKRDGIPADVQYHLPIKFLLR